jgi:hypothetical protein
MFIVRDAANARKTTKRWQFGGEAQRHKEIIEKDKESEGLACIF